MRPALAALPATSLDISFDTAKLAALATDAAQPAGEDNHDNDEEA